jgi:hypothetical protein
MRIIPASDTAEENPTDRPVLDSRPHDDREYVATQPPDRDARGQAAVRPSRTMALLATHPPGATAAPRRCEGLDL